MTAEIKNNKEEPIREFEYLSPLVDFVLGFADIADEMKNEEVGISCYVTDVKVDLPVEFGMKVDDVGNVSLASAPPTQQIETTIFPVLHRMRLGLVVEDGPETE